MTLDVPTLHRRGAAALALVLAAGALAACGSSSSGSSSTASTSTAGQTQSKVQSSATTGTALALAPVEKGEDHLSFSKKTLTAKAGKVTITVANASSNEYPHGIAIEGNGVDKDGAIVHPGGTSTVTVNLKPGTYTFYCPVHNHEKYGMKGTLTVQ
jgi:plastocyanin